MLPYHKNTAEYYTIIIDVLAFISSIIAKGSSGKNLLWIFFWSQPRSFNDHMVCVSGIMSVFSRFDTGYCLSIRSKRPTL